MTAKEPFHWEPTRACPNCHLCSVPTTDHEGTVCHMCALYPGTTTKEPT